MMQMLYKKLLTMSLALMIGATGCAGAPQAGQSAPDQTQPPDPQAAAPPAASPSPSPQLRPATPGEEIAVFHTNHGEIWVRLFPELVPVGVENFVTHARNGFYDGLIFHRVIENFMIQGGCPLGNGTGGESIWGGSFGDEFTPYLRHITGALAYANSGPNTNGSQFYIVNMPTVDPDMADFLEYVIENQHSVVIGPDGPLTDPDGSEVIYAQVFPEDIARAYLETGGTSWLDGRHTVFGQVIRGMDVVRQISSTPTGPGDRPIDDVIIETIEIRPYS